MFGINSVSKNLFEELRYKTNFPTLSVFFILISDCTKIHIHILYCVSSSLKLWNKHKSTHMKQGERSSDNFKQTRISSTESCCQWMRRINEGVEKREGEYWRKSQILHHTPALPITFITAAISGEVFGSRDVMLAEGSVITLANWVIHHKKTVETISNIQ